MDDLAPRLRDALDRAGYTHDAVVDLLGPTAQAALERNETTPGLRATRGGSVVETLVRLWILQTSVSTSAAEAALPGLVDPLCAAGLLDRSVGEVAARIDVRPYGVDGDRTLWIASDLTPGLDGLPHVVGPEHVLGLSPASTSLAQLTLRTPAGSALDLGTGCGVQALHLAEHVDRVVATDVNQRALWLARLNAGLNDVAARIDVRDGSFFEPVRDERFDLIATNPPFVISPATGERLVYRDSGLPGDQVVEHVVRGIPDHLTEGGTGQVLANWMITRDRPWQERLGAWLSDECDAWVVQREVLDPAAYVELWLKDAGQHPSTGRDVPLAEYRRRYDTWLSWFDEQGAEGIGFGWINLRRRTTAAGPDHRLEEWPWEVGQPIAGEIDDHFRRAALLDDLPDERLVATHLVARPDVQQESVGPPGAADPAVILLRQGSGLRRGRQVDTVTAALVGASDGDLTVGQILSALEDLLGGPTHDRLDEVRDLVAEGFLDPAAEAGRSRRRRRH